MRLHMGHFAFMRAVVQGLDTRQSWDRYLRLEGEHDDIRNVRRTIQWIRDEFAAAARRNSKHGVARLIQLDPARINDDKAIQPDLEDFAIEHGLEDFSQAEQLEYYKAHFGAAPNNQSRRRRLVTRQLEALRWLEELAVKPPQSTDPVDSWLNPDLAGRLENADVKTLEELVLRINGIGHRWWASVPGIGAGKAERIVAWLRAQESALGLTIGTHVDTPRTSLAPQQLSQVVTTGAAIVPIEKFVAPPELDGSDGVYRAEKCLCRIDAENDVQAVLAWIRSKCASEHEQAPPRMTQEAEQGESQESSAWPQRLTHTQRSYLKEGERFLLWAVLQKKKALSSIASEDCDDYLSFLIDPSPAGVWCGRRGREKWSPLWRPFEGPLSPAARRHAVVVLKNLFGFLLAQGYVIHNPWQKLGLPPASKKLSTLRRFSQSHWDFIDKYVAAMPQTSANRRLAFALDLIKNSGLRLGQVVSARTDDLVPVSAEIGSDLNSIGAVQLRAVGHRGKQSEISLPPAVIRHLSEYLQSRGLHADPWHIGNKGVYLLGQATDIHERAPWTAEHKRLVDPKDGIAPGTLYDQLKSFFFNCAQDFSKSSSSDGKLFRAASTTWLRSASLAQDNQTSSPDH
jgi:site-specific recombinase XerD